MAATSSIPTPVTASAPPASASPLTSSSLAPPAGPSEAKRWEPGVVIGASVLVRTVMRPNGNTSWVVRCACGETRVMDPSVLAARVAGGAAGRCGHCARRALSKSLRVVHARALGPSAPRALDWPRDILRDLVAEIEAESVGLHTDSPSMRAILERAKRVLA